MTRHTVTAADAPAPVAAYSQATRIGNVLAVAGQVGMDSSGNVVGPDVATQTEQALRNLRAVLAAGGATLDDVVRIDAYLVARNDLTDYNDIYARWFTVDPPARTTVFAGLAEGLKVEITALAVVEG